MNNMWDENEIKDLAVNRRKYENEKKLLRAQVDFALAMADELADRNAALENLNARSKDLIAELESEIVGLDETIEDLRSELRELTCPTPPKPTLPIKYDPQSYAIGDVWYISFPRKAFLDPRKVDPLTIYRATIIDITNIRVHFRYMTNGHLWTSFYYCESNSHLIKFHYKVGA